MPYYPTIAEDLARAKRILADGKPQEADLADFDGLPPQVKQCLAAGGTIFGADIYAAYKLLESLVAEVERLHPLLAEVREQYDRHQRQYESAGGNPRTRKGNLMCHLPYALLLKLFP
jgi:hypothetical protein